MRRIVVGTALGVAGGVLFAGCGSMGMSKDLQAVVYDTQKRVTKLNDELGTSVGQLNQTTTELYSRVEANENTAARLQNVVEENQRKLDQLSGELRKFRDTVYQQLGVTPGGAPVPAPSGLGPGGVIIEPPSR